MNKNITTNEWVGKMRSLMERTENPMSHYSAMLNEAQMISESTRIGANSLIEFLTKYQVHRGSFVNLGYIQIYPVGNIYPNDDIYNKMSATRDEYDQGNTRGLGKFDSYMDKVANTEWNAPTGKKNKAGVPMAKKMYNYVLKLTTYTIHWQNEKSFNDKYGKMSKDLADAKGAMSDATRSLLFRAPSTTTGSAPVEKPAYHNIGNLGAYDISTFSSRGDSGEYEPYKQQYFTDPDDETTSVDYDRTAIRNILSDVKPQHPVYFGINDDGTIDPMPKTLGQILAGKSDSNVDAKLAQISDPNELALAKKYFDLEKKFNLAFKTFLTHNVAYVCGRASQYGEKGGESVYWVNKNPLFLLDRKTSKRGTYKYLYNNISTDELEAILDRFASNKADELNSMANSNVEGETMYADEDY